MQEQTPPPLSQIGLGFLVAAARRRIKQVVWARLAPLGLTPQQFWIMLVLHRQGPHSLHPLAQAVWMDDPTASRVVKTLCDRGLLRSDPDPAHGRRILIRPTLEGTRVARDLEAIAGEVRERLVDGMDPEEQAAVGRSLARMITNLDVLAGELPRPRRAPQPRRVPLRPKVSNL